LIYAVFVPFFSLWAEFGRKYPGVIGESGTEAQAGNLPFPLGGCTDLVQIYPSFAEGPQCYERHISQLCGDFLATID
jgi:hypothetical protein